MAHNVDHNRIIHGEVDDSGAAFVGLRRQLVAFEPLTFQVDELIGEGDQVVARVAQRGVHGGTCPRMPEPTGRSFGNEAIWTTTMYRRNCSKTLVRYSPTEWRARNAAATSVSPASGVRPYPRPPAGGGRGQDGRLLGIGVLHLPLLGRLDRLGVGRDDGGHLGLAGFHLSGLSLGAGAGTTIPTGLGDLGLGLVGQLVGDDLVGLGGQALARLPGAGPAQPDSGQVFDRPSLVTECGGRLGRRVDLGERVPWPPCPRCRRRCPCQGRSARG
ncbi:hypothetical protein [Kitasatospora purpeofusca]|uniref:hypothetical protein n=1 Tax=Kitasatospora purpeofusca TaxID=67352 RepID=UPI00365F42F0